MIKFQLIKTQKEYIYRGKNHTFIYTKIAGKLYLSIFDKKLQFAEDRQRYYITSHEFENLKEIFKYVEKDNKLKRS